MSYGGTYDGIKNTEDGGIVMVHSEKLEETKLWQAYRQKVSSNEKRSGWVKDVYQAAAKYMVDVRQTFQNYTLHDETHILNVLDAMGGLLGDRISELTAGEMELLILTASLHDLGMVYTEEERVQCYKDEVACRKFLREYCPEMMGCPAEDWAEDIRKWYLRTLHPFRLPKVLQNAGWKELFDRCPLEVVPKRCIIAVCQAHGENPSELYNNKDLKHLAANDANPLFCALLLRLGDLLDFDDTRAPRILYGYVACNERSREEWDKHQASGGFRYPDSPSGKDLPYKARCTNPGVEHAIRDFLDWVEEELVNCAKLQKYCSARWQQDFPFPRAVLKDEIESDGYMSGDFCLTMDQEQILNLLAGENLYNNTDVFIRELLQNAIDAVLLREKMEKDFVPEKSRIDLWEWNDKEGNIWFRIDDQGTGMTLGMLKRYFLKVGNSYYNSRELERDLKDHGQMEKYNGISRFGIGFLSSFLCGDYAEVSTLYFDPDKNCREETVIESYRTKHYGLRLQITGLSGYFTLKNQASDHETDGQLPAADGYGGSASFDLEQDGYRVKPGTSIAIRLEPGKLGTLNLREATEKYLCGARVPVYYNNKRIGRTYEEIMKAAHEMEGERFYEMTPEMKERFDRSFPAVRGQYPKLIATVIPLDTEENQILPEFSGVIMKYDVHFDKIPEWRVKDQVYEIGWHFDRRGKSVEITFMGKNRSPINMYGHGWDALSLPYETVNVEALETEFEKRSACPKEEDIKEIWQPFAEKMDLYETWRVYHDNQQCVVERYSLAEFGCPDMEQLCSVNQYMETVCVYQGVVAGDLKEYHTLNENRFSVFFLGSAWKPKVDIGRSKISGLPLKSLIAINGIFEKYHMADRDTEFGLREWRAVSFKEWREARASLIDKWMKENLSSLNLDTKQELQNTGTDLLPIEGGFTIYTQYIYDRSPIIDKYLAVYFQDKYKMTINYEDGQVISFYEKGSDEAEDAFDLLPPMMFCKAASDRSRCYICSYYPLIRRGITADHPFIVWLLNNAVPLKKYYQRQVQQIVDCLCDSDGDGIIKECNRIREQLIALPEHHGVDVGSFPKLSRGDFWLADK